MASTFHVQASCLRTCRRAVLNLSQSPQALSKASFTLSTRPITIQCFRRLPFPQISRDPSIPTRTPRSIHQSRTASTKVPASPGTATNTSPVTGELLTWNRFFDLRKKRRYINLVASLVIAASSIVVAGPLLAAQDVDAWGAQMTGIDPMFVLGASTLAVGAVGWLCGPTFGNVAFRAWAGRRGWNSLIAEKEKSFYARIKRYRADPSSSSPQNPIPDYYGEKIASVKDYRRWLKDQKAFNLKKDKNML